jgi:hypothetical protein
VQRSKKPATTTPQTFSPWQERRATITRQNRHGFGDKRQRKNDKRRS